MAGFFSMFPKVPYNFKYLGVNQNIIDVFRSVRNEGNFVDNPSSYKKYNIINGERPDIVSQRLYGTPDYYWTFFVINDNLAGVHSDWPMSQESINQYVSLHMSGTVIETRPAIIRDTDGLVTEYRNSFSGLFNIGETITGSSNGATGTLRRKNSDLSQLTLDDVDGTFIGINDTSTSVEKITGNISLDFVDTYKVWEEKLAPSYWYVTGDKDKKPVTVDTVVSTGHPRYLCSYVSNYEALIDVNDENSKIRIIDPAYISTFVSNFKDVLNG